MPLYLRKGKEERPQVRLRAFEKINLGVIDGGGLQDLPLTAARPAVELDLFRRHRNKKQHKSQAQSSFFSIFSIQEPAPERAGSGLRTIAAQIASLRKLHYPADSTRLSLYK